MIIGWVLVWWTLAISVVTGLWMLLVELRARRERRRHFDWLREQRRLARNEVRELYRDRYRRTI